MTKQEELDGLVNVINLNVGKWLSPKQQERVDALQVGLTERLKKLVAECKERELDLKIESMKAVVELLKGKKVKNLDYV